MINIKTIVTKNEPKTVVQLTWDVCVLNFIRTNTYYHYSIIMKTMEKINKPNIVITMIN